MTMCDHICTCQISKRYLYSWHFYSTEQRKVVTPFLITVIRSCTHCSYLVHTLPRHCSFLKQAFWHQRKSRQIFSSPPPWNKYKTRPSNYVKYRNQRNNAPFFYFDTQLIGRYFEERKIRNWRCTRGHPESQKKFEVT